MAPGVTQIAASAIENAVGTAACPFVTGIIATTAIDDLFAQWNGEFDEWFDNLKAQLSDNVVANLQKQIDECKKGLTAKGTIIDSTTAQVLQLTEGSNVVDALLALALPSGKYAVSVTLLTPGGKPFPNQTISGLVTSAGGAVITNEQGKAFGFATSSPVNISINTAKYMDIGSNTTISIPLEPRTINQLTIPVNRISGTQKIFTSSVTAYFSPDVIEYDWSAVGGGQNGASGTVHDGIVAGYPNGHQWSASGGKGGNSGGIINKPNNKYTPETPIQIIVGGIGGNSSVNDISTSSESASPGGEGGYAHYAILDNPDDPIRRHTNGTKGQPPKSNFLYPPTDVGGSGGGGGSKSVSVTASSGTGANGGGDGSNTSGSTGGNATKYGGGGGGGYGYHNGGSTSNTSSGGKGMQGCVGMIWRFES